ncbi:hypothetical protein [Phytohabitans aurantiacus]|uniref:hypothetical protein n=1 Tax=Phytohabitans aurantiacus TaxID=3016789 RepID=UPI0024922E85|nr:hypothetical protein [Phytohabitans aurantiacus]
MSRRELLAALGIGALGRTLTTLDHAAAAISVDEMLLAELADSLRGVQAAARVLPPHQLIQPLTAQVGLLEVTRRRAPHTLRAAFTQLQAQHAESLSWMAEEAGDLPSAIYWTDRAQHWATQLGWSAMNSYSHVRRSMLAISFSGDGHAAIEQATQALRTPGAPARIRGLAAKQLAYGHSLAGHADASKQALDQTLVLFEAAGREQETGPLVGQRSVATPDLLAIYRGHLRGLPRRRRSGDRDADAAAGADRRRSRRTLGITSAKLAQAYAHADAPDQACQLILATLDGTAAVDSLSTRSELRRALPLLARWPHRDDVAEVRHRLAALG